MLVVKLAEKFLFHLESRHRKIQDKSQRQKLEGIYFMTLTVFIDISEEILFVAQFMMELKMVQTLSEDPIFDAVLILEVLIGLAPPQVYEQLFAVLYLKPVRSGLHNRSNQLAVVSGS